MTRHYLNYGKQRFLARTCVTRPQWLVYDVHGVSVIAVICLLSNGSAAFEWPKVKRPPSMLSRKCIIQTWLCIPWVLTLLVLNPEYYGKTRSIHWLLTPWLASLRSSAYMVLTLQDSWVLGVREKGLQLLASSQCWENIEHKIIFQVFAYKFITIGINP